MRSLSYIIILSLLAAPAAMAKPSQGQSKHSKYIQEKKAQQERRVEQRRVPRYAFPQNDVRVIREYYTPRYRSLPPGLQKKLYRTGQLPPGWQKKLHPLPVVVERRLAPVPSIYRRGIMDDSIVVVDPRRNVVVDVIPAFVRR